MEEELLCILTHYPYLNPLQTRNTNKNLQDMKWNGIVLNDNKEKNSEYNLVTRSDNKIRCEFFFWKLPFS